MSHYSSQANKEKKREYDRLRHIRFADKNIERAKKWRAEHKSERYQKEKIKLQSSFSKRFYKSAMAIIRRHFLHHTKITKSKTASSLGYSFAELKTHLLTTLPIGFNWQDYIKGELQIDHIVCHKNLDYDSADCDSFRQCWSLNNLRLLETHKNISKQS